MAELPAAFLDEMKRILGNEYGQFLDSYHMPAGSGLRLNRRKVSGTLWEKIAPFPCTKVPWVSDGYYVCENDRPARDVYYHAGLYYLQEPSAMTPADRLPVTPGERVLDLCAAPGGKATALGAKLDGQGLLVANDSSVSRAQALLKNIELAGIPNAVVTAETPDRLAGRFPEYFDKILVDAPCSGEGMFRRDPSMIKSWLEKDGSYYAPVQREILSHAAGMLKPGGLLLYSTCTFSPRENEDNIRWFLNEFPDFQIQPIRPYEGFEDGIYPDVKACVRIWPHRMEGEGHFLALLKKKETCLQKEAALQKWVGDGKATPSFKKSRIFSEPSYRDEKKLQTVENVLAGTDFWIFMKPCSFPVETDRMMLLKDSLYLLPEEFENPEGLRVLRSGLLLGTLKSRRFAPSQAFAMALEKEQFAHRADFDKHDLRVVKYLKGETISLDDDQDGWVLVCADGFPLGWGKASSGTLKNKYAPGWRMR